MPGGHHVKLANEIQLLGFLRFLSFSS